MRSNQILFKKWEHYAYFILWKNFQFAYETTLEVKYMKEK